MKYKQIIEDNFLIDEPKEGKHVPFKFNEVQQKYYQELVDEYDIENKGLQVPVRELVLKARREGFSSLILALFAADDLLSKNPTESMVISYKDDATKTFRKRYKLYIKSFFENEWGVTDEKEMYDQNKAGEYTLKHNGARFYCGTASAKTGERGGVLQKVLFSEAAFYPDTEIMTAKEIIEGTLRQVDISSGWAFVESTANGTGNHYHKMWRKAETGESRFSSRFYGWREFYNEDEMKLIRSEFTDDVMFKQEYPETPEEAFISSVNRFVGKESLDRLIEAEKPNKRIYDWLELHKTNYIEQCELITDWIESAVKQNPNKNFYCGIDVARDVDSTVATLLATKGLNQRGGLKAMSIDSTGVGDFMPDWFENNTSYKVHRVKFTAQQKDAIYGHLRTVIQQVMTTIPDVDSEEAKRFFEQILSLQKEIKGRLLRIFHPEGGFDDYPDSWALAEHSYLLVHGSPKPNKIKEEKLLKDPVSRMLARKEQKTVNREIGFENE